LVLPGHKIGPFGEAVLEPDREKGIDMTLKIPWNGSATRFGQIDSSHGQHNCHCGRVFPGKSTKSEKFEHDSYCV